MKNRVQLEQLKKDILAMLEEKLPSCYYYHNDVHTMEVIENARLLGNEAGLSEEEQILLETAAILHDCGYLETYRNNEPKGAKFAERILPQYGYNEDEIKIISDMILATSFNINPETKLEKLIRDADVGYIGTKKFFNRSDDLRHEIEEVVHPITDRQWYELEVKYLDKFKFYTSEANKLFSEQLNENRDKINKTLEDME